jgi:hypothetical protein
MSCNKKRDNGTWDLPKADPNRKTTPYRDSLSDVDKIKWDAMVQNLKDYYNEDYNDDGSRT